MGYMVFLFILLKVQIGMEKEMLAVLQDYPITWQQLCFHTELEHRYSLIETLTLIEGAEEADICIRSSFVDGIPLGRYANCNNTYDITTKYTDLSERMEFLYNQCTDLYGNHTPSYKKFRILEEGLHFPYFEIKAPSKLMFLCGNLALPKLPYFWKGRCAVGYLKAPLRHARSIAERRMREGNIFLDLMKVALNSTSLCVRGETTVSDIMATCFVGVPVPGKFLFEEANIVIEPNNLNLSHIITLFGSPQKPTKWTNQKKLVIEVKTILPAYDCVIYKHPEKRPEKVIYVPVPNKKVFHCSETEEVEAINQVLYLPKGWFLFCGLYAYAYIPAYAVGGPCTIGRLTTVMAVAHFKDINYKTEFYYEMMNASLYHTDRVQKKVMTKVTTHGGVESVEGHGNGEIPRPEGEPHLIIYAPKNPTKWHITPIETYDHVGEGTYKGIYRGKRDATQLEFDANCNDEVVVLNKVQAGLLGMFPWMSTQYSQNQLGHLACALAKSINETSSAIAALADEMGEIRQSLLQNRVAIDYMLLRMGHGCEEFHGLCCFNVSDRSQFIESKIKTLHNITTHLTYVTENTAFKEVWGILTSWLPSFTWLRELFVGILLIVVICLISCLCIKCIPLCCNVWKCCCRIKKQKKLVEDSHGGLGRREVSIMLQDIHSFQE
ncbi:uncharacterized protein LOC132710250 [Pantherophis guttatus]|uniref:Uncharacterized protein LOC132709566 n=1 Tax=Pantherophis guttatus TaxID=94885 RepID=A0ABM3Z0Q0_PANGU|nr:uncharacterized protein LOC132709566 [Pantherophis guttatus]XP_060541958.1 uncharacterized protein LOC132710250 [Pantherophis guttatus]